MQVVKSYTQAVMEEAAGGRSHYDWHFCKYSHAHHHRHLTDYGNAQCCYIILLVLLNVSCYYATNEFHPDLLDDILSDPGEVQERILGSKIVVGSNQAYLLTLWGVKACLLMLYHTMTKDTRSAIFVKHKLSAVGGAGVVAVHGRRCAR